MQKQHPGKEKDARVAPENRGSHRRFDSFAFGEMDIQDYSMTGAASRVVSSAEEFPGSREVYIQPTHVQVQPQPTAHQKTIYSYFFRCGLRITVLFAFEHKVKTAHRLILHPSKKEDMTAMRMQPLPAAGILWLSLFLVGSVSAQEEDVCTFNLEESCASCGWGQDITGPAKPEKDYNCSLPGLTDFAPGGQFEGVQANYLSYATSVASPNFLIRAEEFQACTGGRIVFSDAADIFADPVEDMGTSTRQGSEVYDGYFMSYSHFPEVSALGLTEPLNERIRQDNSRLKWEDVLPKVKQMGEYRHRNGQTNIEFLMYDGDFFVPIVRLDLLEKHNLPLPNSWEELAEYANFFNNTDLNDDGEPDFGICHFPATGALQHVVIKRKYKWCLHVARK